MVLVATVFACEDCDSAVVNDATVMVASMIDINCRGEASVCTLRD